jgi:hypothetical protein
MAGLCSVRFFHAPLHDLTKFDNQQRNLTNLPAYSYGRACCDEDRLHWWRACAERNSHLFTCTTSVLALENAMAQPF